jgi:hypothetical protein
VTGEAVDRPTAARAAAAAVVPATANVRREGFRWALRDVNVLGMDKVDLR